jgi:hypothetical protein
MIPGGYTRISGSFTRNQLVIYQMVIPVYQVRFTRIPEGLCQDTRWLYDDTRWLQYTKIAGGYTRIPGGYTKIAGGYTRIPGDYIRIPGGYTRQDTRWLYQDQVVTVYQAGYQVVIPGYQVSGLMI